VKEFADDLALPGGAGGAFDPYVGIRSKISKASEKFRDYDGECCTLVLFNERANLVDIRGYQEGWGRWDDGSAPRG